MKNIYGKKAWLGICLVLSFVLGSLLWAPVKAEQRSNGTGDPAGIQTLLPEVSAAPSETPAVTEGPALAETPLPSTAAPIPTASPAPLVLKNKNAVYRAGKQKGIGYGKIKKGKIYRISSYGSDTVKLLPSKKSGFKVTGGIRNREITSKKIRVSQAGMVA